MSITAVPLRPVKKGSVAKLWIAIVALGAAGAGAAMYQTAPYTERASVQVVKPGQGPVAADGDAVVLSYVGKLSATGKTFDESPQPVPMPVVDGFLIKGFIQGLKQMQAGGQYKLHIPSALAYGPEEKGGGVIPANSDLDFDITVVQIVPGGAKQMGLPGVQ
jgi:FKBP-type peptidyl-prolyl cis-trans isomerase FkpA